MTKHMNFTTNPAAPVLALHSSASNGTQWKHLAHLLDRKFDVNAPDLPGYGSPSHGMNALEHSNSLTDLTATALPLICNILRTNQPHHLVGHSYGGAVALKIALMRPDLIKSLTLYEPVAFHLLKNGDREDKKCLAEIELISAILTTAAATGRPDLGMMRFIDFWNGEGAWDKFAEKNRTVLTNQSTSVMSDFIRAYSETWTLSDLQALNIPTLIFLGTKSPSVAKRIATKVANSIPHCNLELMEGFKHIAPVTSPDLINPLIQQHIINVEQASVEYNWPILSAS